jgi:hypothetical protein
MRRHQKHVTIALLRPAVCQVAQERGFLFFEERRRSIVERLGGRQRILSIIELDERHPRVSVDEGMPADAPDAFERAYVVGVLRAEMAWMFRLDLALASFSRLARSSAGAGVSVRMKFSRADLASSIKSQIKQSR